MTPPLILRRDAAAATKARFDGRTFKWSSNDCVRMAAFHLRKLGYKPVMPKAGTYHTPLGAMKALRAAGFERLEDALAATGLTPIAPAQALVGDIVALPGEGDLWPALTVALGNGRVLGFMEGRCGVLQPALHMGAWRANPCRR